MTCQPLSQNLLLKEKCGIVRDYIGMSIYFMNMDHVNDVFFLWSISKIAAVWTLLMSLSRWKGLLVLMLVCGLLCRSFYRCECLVQTFPTCPALRKWWPFSNRKNVRHVRLYDADRAMLLALANTGIQVPYPSPMSCSLVLVKSNATAANWVARNIIDHVPATNITSIAVGSEVLTALPNAAPVLVSALKFIHSALVASNLDSQIKVSTPHSSSIILDSFPPSQAFFNRSWDPVMVPLLKFLQSTGSYLMLNVYPYYDYMQSNSVIPLDYALFHPLPPNKEAVDANTLLHYTNGDSSEPDATVENANTYNSNLIKHVINNTGTPKHPGIAVSTYIYELYNEDLSPGPASEQNWGLFDANGVPVYILHLTGAGTIFANDTTNQTFCVARESADPKMLQAALDWACGPGKVNCSPLLQGQPCYEPNNVVSHSTYAFNAYFQQMGKSTGTCDFKGVATITTTDPSHGSCVFPGSFGKNGTITNGTSLAPSSNDSSSGYPLQYFYGSDSLTTSVIIGVCVLVVLDCTFFLGF
ncbi:hypothetical protein GQ457_18G025740 [Hibiscus cannabinus]